MRVPHQLDLVELMHAKQTTRVLAMRSSLAPEAGRISGECPRQIRLGNYLVTIEIGERNFRGRNEEQLLVAQAVLLVLELGELRRARHRLAIDNGWNPGLLISVLARVRIEHEVHE